MTDGFAEIVARRRSCRAFLPGSVPRGTIAAILRTAGQTASWNNTQPWQVVLCSGAATERFRALMTGLAQGDTQPAPDYPFPREYRGEAQERRRACGFQLYAAVGVARGDKAGYARQGMENFRLFGAPHYAVITSDEALGTYGAVDCGAYASVFMLAAEAHGVASIAQAAIAQYAGPVRDHFGLGADRRVVCGIAFGWPDPAAAVNAYRTPRAAEAEIVDWRDD